MAIIGNLITRVGADINPLQKGLKNASKSLNNFSAQQKQALYGMQSNMKKLMNGMSIGGIQTTKAFSAIKVGALGMAAAAVSAFALISKNAIKSAMDVVESENLFEVSMGNMAGTARKWSDQLQQSLGLNGYEVRKNVGLFYNMTTAMGLAQNQAYEISTGITKLAYDMSSFYNISYDEMFTKLQAGLSGEIEPLRRLGVIVNETTTKNYAYKNGIAKVGAELTESQKIMARYGVIMAATKNAQGDLARTITSPANQLRLLQTQLQLASINMGNAFMPIVEKVLPILTSFAKGLVSVTNTFAQFMKALFGTNSAQAQNAKSAADAATAQTNLGKTTAAAGEKAKRGIAGFDEINQLQENIAASAGDAADAISTTPIPEKQDIQITTPSAIKEAADQLKNTFKPALDDVGDSFSGLKQSAKDLWSTLEPYIKPVAETIFEGLKNKASGLATNGLGALSGAFKQLDGVATLANGVIKGDFPMALSGAEKAANGTWQILKSGLLTAFPDLKNGVESAEKSFKESWSRYKDHVKTYGDPTKLEISDFVEDIRGKFQNLKEDISNKWSETKTNTLTKWEEIKTSLAEKWESFKTTIHWDDIKNIVLSHWDTLKTDTSSKWDNFKNTLQEKWDAIRNIKWGSVKDALLESWGGLKSETATIWGNIKTTIKNSINDVIGYVNGFIRNINSTKVTIPPVTIAGKKIFNGISIGFPQIPEIPKLAKGGIVTAPTLAQIGEKGKEAVIPLENTSFIDTLAGAIGSAVLSAMKFAQPQQQQPQGNAILEIDGTKLARVIFPYLSAEESRIGNTAIVGV